MGKTEINEQDLDQIVGGQFLFNCDTMMMTYVHSDGSFTTHKILQYDRAWKASNYYHTNKIPEDEILQKMISQGLIEG